MGGHSKGYNVEPWRPTLWNSRPQVVPASVHYSNPDNDVASFSSASGNKTAYTKYHDAVRSHGADSCSRFVGKRPGTVDVSHAFTVQGPAQALAMLRGLKLIENR